MKTIKRMARIVALLINPEYRTFIVRSYDAIWDGIPNVTSTVWTIPLVRGYWFAAHA